MTDRSIANRSEEKNKSELISLALLALTVLFGLRISAESAEYVKDGLSLAIGCVIPASFPFMIISDLYIAYGHPEKIRILRSVFERVFGIPNEAISAFICGNVGGFPIGAKMACDIYAAGALSKDDAHRLLALCNNPSCAFVVGGVGLGIFGDVMIGILMLISVYISTVICAMITRKSRCKNDFIDYISRQNYEFVDSVKKSGASCISIISFICVFSVVIGIIKKRVKNALIAYPIFAVLEVTNAIKSCNVIAKNHPILALALAAFSLGFGGVCVGMQSSVFTSAYGLKMRKYYLIKLLQGLICASIFSILFYIKRECGAA